MKNIRLLTGMCGFILLTGCAIRSGQEVDTSGIQKIERGKSTKADIRKLFGEPQFVNQSAQGETWFYQYLHAGYATPIGVLGMKMKNDNLSISFEGDVVKDYSWNVLRQVGPEM